MTRKNFIEGLGAAVALSGCQSAGLNPATRRDGSKLNWGTLVHLGTNMWKDWTPEGVYPKSLAEEERLVAAGKIEYHEKSRVYVTRDYMSVDWPTWDSDIACIHRHGLNTLFIDLGEAYEFPSHPELAVRGSLKTDEMRAVINRIRAQGIEVYPKLNFSAGHDQWLREYHWQTGTAKYRQVVADLIRDVCELFGCPRYFHIGYDEESYACVCERELIVLRQGETWWKDFNSCIDAVMKNGSRPVMWSDKICHGREEFLARMPKSVVMMTWYYGSDFSDENTQWDVSYEKKTDWSIQRNLVASIPTLAQAGFDLMPCTSNWLEPNGAEAMLDYCSRSVDPKRILGYLTAPWTKPVPSDSPRFQDAIKLFDEARRRFYWYN